MEQTVVGTVITEIIDRTYNVKSFRLDDKGARAFTAGQFMSVALGEGKDLTRWLSISSSPTEKGYIEFTKKITDSEFSKRLKQAKPGDEVTIKYPFGNFTVKEDIKKIAFLSGGIGITPIRSIAKYICDEKRDISMVLLYGNRSSADIAFKDDFDIIERECPGFKVVHILSQPEAAWEGRKGHISTGLVTGEIPDYKERQFYICGPPLMVSGMKCILKDDLGLPEDRITYENFAGY